MTTGRLSMYFPRAGLDGLPAADTKEVDFALYFHLSHEVENKHKLFRELSSTGNRNVGQKGHRPPLPESFVERKMNRNLKLIFAFGSLATLIPVLAQATAAHPKDRKKETHPASGSAEITRGQEVFEQNCSRCHNAPQGIPPKISATVIRHMRIRASLSAADEKALLQFMNP
ncbi:MAG TPA: cytochrome c [Terracidiphilus sp.]|nr:cytochrome c [Terracidiphilus sp.]